MILLRHRYWQIETYRRQAQTEAQGEKSLRTFYNVPSRNFLSAFKTLSRVR